jgi:hypothetical protein
MNNLILFKRKSRHVHFAKNGVKTTNTNGVKNGSENTGAELKNENEASRGARTLDLTLTKRML